MCAHDNLRSFNTASGVRNLRDDVARVGALLAREMTGLSLRLSRELPAGFIATRWARGDATAGPLLPQSYASISHEQSTFTLTFTLT